VQEFATEASDEQGHPSFFIDFHSLLEMAAAHACRNKLRYGSTSTTATDGLRPSATVSHAEPHLHFIRICTRLTPTECGNPNEYAALAEHSGFFSILTFLIIIL
jgi:hypothetical protein